MRHPRVMQSRMAYWCGT